MKLPEWWDWELVLTSHIEKRMEERGFTEIELRRMLSKPVGLLPDAQQGRFVVLATLQSTQWAIIVEPEYEDQILVAVTAFPNYGEHAYD